MNTAEMRGDFIGFYFNGHHSSEFNIIRTSDGNRYNESLLPAFNDKTTQVIGSNETYYFGMNYTQKQIDINFAFDSLTITNFQKLKQWLSNPNPSKLYFDEDRTDTLTTPEAPEGIYRFVKINGQPSIKYLCFDEKGEKIYKGEGSISFVSFYPFALQDKDPCTFSEDDVVTIHNAGLRETDWIIEIPFPDNNIIAEGSIYLNDSSSSSKINLGAITRKGADTKIIINSKTNTIEGRASGNTLGNIYNDSILSGRFFKINVPTPSTTDIRFFCTVGGGINGRILTYKEIYY